MEMLMEKYILVIIPVVFVVAAIAGIIMNKKVKSQANAYLEQHPDAAKVFPSMKVNGLTQGTVTVDSVDGQIPAKGMEKNKFFVYAASGTRILEASFSSTRPGVMHKSVTKTWGPVKLEVEIKPNGRYELQFDKDTESFQLVEI